MTCGSCKGEYCWRCLALYQRTPQRGLTHIGDCKPAERDLRARELRQQWESELAAQQPPSPSKIANTTVRCDECNTSANGNVYRYYLSIFLSFYLSIHRSIHLYISISIIPSWLLSSPHVYILATYYVCLHCPAQHVVCSPCELKDTHDNSHILKEAK